MQALKGIEPLTRAVLLEKVASIANGATVAELKEFIDYLTIFEKYSKAIKTDK